MNQRQRVEETFGRYRPLVDDWETFADAALRPLPTCIWTNTLRTSPDELGTMLRRHGVELTPVDWYPGAFRVANDDRPGNRFEYLTGLYHVQEEVSLVPPVLLDARPGERVLDSCAAPGNKTAQIAVSMDNRGTVVANDRDPHRNRAVKRVIDRLGLVNVSVTTYDGANFSADIGPFDRIQVDVPCTCEGTSRKHPETLENVTVDFCERMSGSQRALLRKAVQLCRSGGRIVYSTCTYAPEENEMVVDAILEEVGRDRIRIPEAKIDGLVSSPGVTEWRGRQLDERLSRAMRIWPHQNDTGGFFVCILEIE